jgi:hypothetical protein
MPRVVTGKCILLGFGNDCLIITVTERAGFGGILTVLTVNTVNTVHSVCTCGTLRSFRAFTAAKDNSSDK